MDIHTLDIITLSSGSLTSTCIPTPGFDGMKPFVRGSYSSTLYVPAEEIKIILVDKDSEKKQAELFQLIDSCVDQQMNQSRL